MCYRSSTAVVVFTLIKLLVLIVWILNIVRVRQENRTSCWPATPSTTCTNTTHQQDKAQHSSRQHPNSLTLAKRKGWNQKHAIEAETPVAAEGAPHLPRFSDETE